MTPSALRPSPRPPSASGRIVAGAGSRALAWPLPALAGWFLAWAACLALAPTVGSAGGLAAGVLAGLAVALRARGTTRRLWIALGFPLSALAVGAPAAVWALALATLLWLHPPRAWRDAPLFPTPPGALDGLATHLPLPPGARVLDAGCGVGHGLEALRRAWPQARVEGIELSRPWAALAAWRCRWARVRRGDLWTASWAGCALVYLYQRPESMASAWTKAEGELPPGGWLVSLEFDLPGRRPDIVAATPCGRPVRAWRVGTPPSPPPPAQAGAGGADMPG